MQKKIDSFSWNDCKHCKNFGNCEIKEKLSKDADKLADFLFKSEIQIEESFTPHLECRFFMVDEKTLRETILKK